MQRGNEVVLTVADDGGGLNFPRIRQKALETGLLAPDVELPESQLAQFIFASGFSTAETVSQVSGRGVGMDVVKNEITSLGGRIEIASSAGRTVCEVAAASAKARSPASRRCVFWLE